eukprot:COSAG04_NODE_618_length_11896_cov_81.925659_19_plen_87_part_00
MEFSKALHQEKGEADDDTLLNSTAFALSLVELADCWAWRRAAESYAAFFRCGHRRPISLTASYHRGLFCPSCLCSTTTFLEFLLGT